MNRSKLKGPFIKKINNNLKIISRNFEITPKLVGLTFKTHTGKKFIDLNITEDMIGYKIGEFAPTREKFIFKKKKRNKMGQKTNPNILRIGINKTWKTEFFEKSHKELPIYTFKDLEIKLFVKRFLESHGLILYDYKINYTNSTIVIYMSYCITPNFEFQNKKPISRIKLKSKNRKYFNFINKNFKQNHIKQIFNQEFINHNKKRVFLKPKSTSKLIKYKNLNQLKINSITEKLFKSLKLFTNEKYNIILVLNCINKDLLLNSKQIKVLKKQFISLQKYKNKVFFKEGVNVMFESVYNNNSSELLIKFIASLIKKNNRGHKFLMAFFKKTFKLFIDTNFSKIKGIKIQIKGRLNGASRAKSKTIIVGDVPVQTLNSPICYSEKTAHNINGSYGIKVWIVNKKVLSKI